MNAIEMIQRCAKHQNQDVTPPAEIYTQGWESAINATPAEPELPADERGVVDGYVPLEFLSGLTI